MVFLHKKILYKSMKFVEVYDKPCKFDQFCDRVFTTPLLPMPPPPSPSPPPPPRPKIPNNHSPSPFLFIIFCGLTVCFSFICYLTCAKKFQMRQRNRVNTDHEAHEDLVHEDLGQVLHNPIWLINTIGLDQSEIESIQVFKYKRGEKLIESTDCSVCLSEFEDDERLRLLPKCNHAFHVLCIDTWLRSHKNCPLCRAPIIKNTNHDQTERAITESSSIESSPPEETETLVSVSETIDDHHVVEDENNGEIVKTYGIIDENTITNTQCSSSDERVRVHSDLADHFHVQGDELVLNSHVVRSKKPCSIPKSGHKLKESSSSIHICRKPMKSYSFAHSLRKASSFTSKCGPHNQSY